MDGSEKHPTLRRPYYNEDEAKEILAQAMDLPHSDGFSTAQLVTFAGDLGISPAQLAAAESVWLAGRDDREEEAARLAFIAERRREARNNIAGIVVMGGLLWLAKLFAIPILATVGAFLTVPMAIIGIVIFFQVWGALFETQGEDFDKEFDKWLVRRQTRRARLAPPRAIPRQAD